MLNHCQIWDMLLTIMFGLKSSMKELVYTIYNEYIFIRKLSMREPRIIYENTFPSLLKSWLLFLARTGSENIGIKDPMSSVIGTIYKAPSSTTLKSHMFIATERSPTMTTTKSTRRKKLNRPILFSFLSEKYLSIVPYLISDIFKN